MWPWSVIRRLRARVEQLVLAQYDGHRKEAELRQTIAYLYDELSKRDKEIDRLRSKTRQWVN